MKHVLHLKRENGRAPYGKCECGAPEGEPWTGAKWEITQQFYHHWFAEGGPRIDQGAEPYREEGV